MTSTGVRIAELDSLIIDANRQFDDVVDADSPVSDPALCAVTVCTLLVIRAIFVDGIAERPDDG